jgi:hypothetical protein
MPMDDDTPPAPTLGEQFETLVGLFRDLRADLVDADEREARGDLPRAARLAAMLAMPAIYAESRALRVAIRARGAVPADLARRMAQLAVDISALRRALRGDLTVVGADDPEARLN